MKLRILLVLLTAMVANGIGVSGVFADGLKVQTRFELGEVIADPSMVMVYFYDDADESAPWASQFFTTNQVTFQKNSNQQITGISFNVTAIDTSNTEIPVWFEIELDGTKVGTRQQLLAGSGGLTVAGEIETFVGVRFPSGLQTAPGITSESDPTVLASVKDGVSWGEIGSIPAGFADNTDNGITAETDPFLPAHTSNGSAHHSPYTDLDAVAAILAADGSGSGLDADLLDGQTASTFATTAHNHTSAYVQLTGDDMTGPLTTVVGGAFGAIKGANYNNPTNGYLAVVGTTDFDGITTADWNGLEIGVAGISTGTSNNDNYGVLGQSNGVGVRGEHSSDPANNFAELGLSSIGIRAKGTALAGDFIGAVDVAGDVTLKSSGTLRLKNGSTVHSRLGEVSTGGNLRLYDDGVLTVALEAAESSTNSASLQMRQTNGTLTVDIDADFNSRGAYIALGDETGTVNVMLEGKNSSSGLGRITTDELVITGGADLSEQFDINSMTYQLKPGMLVSINPLQPGKLTISTTAYDNKVAGVISGAGGVVPGMRMGQKGSIADGDYPVALTGRVYAWVDASKEAIQPGDLLTTSNSPGHAMKATDHSKAMGTVIGKAMTPLKSGKGLVLVLVSLQ